MENIGVNNFNNIGVGGMTPDPNKNVDIGLDLLTNEKKRIPDTNNITMNYDAASDDSSDISEGDLDGLDALDENDDSSIDQLPNMDNILEAPIDDDDDRRSQVSFTNRIDGTQPNQPVHNAPAPSPSNYQPSQFYRQPSPVMSEEEARRRYLR